MYLVFSLHDMPYPTEGSSAPWRERASEHGPAIYAVETRAISKSVHRTGKSLSPLGCAEMHHFPEVLCLSRSENSLLSEGRISTWKWRETKQQPIRARSGHQICCCLVSLHFLCDILSTCPLKSFATAALVFKQTQTVHLANAEVAQSYRTLPPRLSYRHAERIPLGTENAMIICL